jgi:hypothetical protein
MILAGRKKSIIVWAKTKSILDLLGMLKAPEDRRTIVAAALA